LNYGDRKKGKSKKDEGKIQRSDFRLRIANFSAERKPSKSRTIPDRIRGNKLAAAGDFELAEHQVNVLFHRRQTQAPASSAISRGPALVSTVGRKPGFLGRQDISP
jgi:hypothetical protein